MNKFWIIATLLMASTAANAGNSVSFEIDGHKIRVEAPSHCDSLSCIRVSAPGLSGAGFDFKGLKSNRFEADDDVAVRSDPPAPVVQPTAPPPSAPAASNALPSSTAMISSVPAANAGDDVAPPAAPAAAATVAPTPAAVADVPVQAPTTPLGIWATEQGKGNVRIEPCGQNLCGYAVKTGEKILINMKPSNAKWTGQIHDPDSGGDYDSTIAMKGTNSLRVQGCAFGGMFCGGQTWKRVS